MASDLYQQLLGHEWRMLADSVRWAHAVGDEKIGCFRVSHGAGWLARRLAGWSHLPPAADSAAIRLKIIDVERAQQWERRFDGHVFTTKQWAERGEHLVERFRSWELSFRLQVTEQTLRYVQRGARLCLGQWRMPWPLALAPRVSAQETSEGPERVRVSVTVTLPFVGLLIAYEGFLERRPAAH